MRGERELHVTDFVYEEVVGGSKKKQSSIHPTCVFPTVKGCILLCPTKELPHTEIPPDSWEIGETTQLSYAVH